MNKPVRTTVVYALVVGLLFLPVSWTLGRYLYSPPGFQLVIWLQLAVYSVLLARWSHTRLISIVFPLILLLVAAWLPAYPAGYLVLALATFSWIRSGISFYGAPMRRLMAEVVTVAGGLAAVVFLVGSSSFSWALGFTLFGVVQALYFFMVPQPGGEGLERVPHDPFEIAYKEAQKIVEAP